MIASVQQPLIRTGSMSSAREMRALKRARQLKELGIKKGDARLSNLKPDFNDAEFSLPDEDREFQFNTYKPCPHCGNFGQLLVRQYAAEDCKPTYTVRCSIVRCGFSTPPLPSSQLAIRHWKLVAALSK